MDSDKIYKQIRNIIQWYGKESSTVDVKTLMDKRDKLAGYSFYLAEDMASHKADYNSIRFIRKIEFSRAFMEMKQVMTNQEAENKANEKIANELKLELDTEAIAYKYQVLLSQTGRVLDAMQQRLSWLKTEMGQSNNQI